MNQTLKCVRGKGNLQRLSPSLYRRFFLPALVVFLAALPPANSAFSVLRARCFVCAALRAAFVSYRTFFVVVVFFLLPRLSTSLTRSPPFRGGGGGGGKESDSACRSEGAGPWMSVLGSKSSTIVTVASCSSSEYCSSPVSLGGADAKPFHSSSSDSASSRARVRSWASREAESGGGNDWRTYPAPSRRTPLQLLPRSG